MVKIIKNFATLKSPDYYRKKYYNRWIKHNTYGGDVFEEGSNIQPHHKLIFTTDEVEDHNDWNGMSYLIILHNDCYKFRCDRRLYDIPTGSLLIFDLNVYHGLERFQNGRRLFIASCVDEQHGYKKRVERPREYLKCATMML